MKKIKNHAIGLAGFTIAISILGYNFWFSWNHSNIVISEYRSKSKELGGEFKVTSQVHLIENPITWINPIPTQFVSRYVIDLFEPDINVKQHIQLENTRVFILDGTVEISGDVSVRPVLIDANCENQTFRYVDRLRYQEYMSNNGFTPLGRKLPDWEDTNIQSMAWALPEEKISAEASWLFKVACEWESVDSIDS